MLISFRFWRVGVVAGLLLGSGVRAQNDAASRRAAIQGMYPVMLGALEAKNYGRARNICDQAIMWEPQNPVHHYNLACIEAQAGGTRLPFAWGALDLAIALGFNDANHLQNDPDLAPLRSDPRFADLVRKVIFNTTAGAAAAASISIPAKSTAPATPAPEVEMPAPTAFKDGLPVGLYLMTRYLSSTQTIEKSAWYFGPDGSVFRNLENGFSKADLDAHAGPRGTARRAGRSFEITWSNGKKSAAALERDGSGFTWDMGIFTPVVAFVDVSELPGVYESSESSATDGGTVAVSQQLELRADGTFKWDGASLVGTPEKETRVSVGNNEATIGQWRWRGLSLILNTAQAAPLRRIVFPNDDEKTVIKPDQMFLGGVMYKRRP